MCLSGLRLGWIVEPNERRRARHLNARNHFSICSGAISERLGTLALTHSDAIYSKARAASGRNLKALDAFFVGHRGALNWHRPRGGMTAYPWMSGVSDTRPFCEELLKRGVMIAPGDCFGAPEHFRLGFAAAGITQFSRALERFSEALRAAAVAAG